MKRILVSAVAGLLVCLTACVKPHPPAAPVPTAAPTPTVTVTPTPTATPTATPTPTPTPEVVSTYQKGNLTDTGFESEWLNLRLVAPEEVAMATQEELDVLMGIGAEVIYADRADYIMAFSDITLVYEMLAKHVSGANVGISVELLANSLRDLTEEQYIEMMLEAAENADIEISSDGTVHSRTLLGEEYKGFYSATTYGNAGTVYQENLVRKKENRMIVISVSYQKDKQEIGEQLLNLFTAYDASNPLPTAMPMADTYEKGIITEIGMESEWMDISFRLPDGMIMATQEEMDEITLGGAGLLHGDNASIFVDYTNFQMVYEMQAGGEYGVPGVQVMVERLAYKNMTEEEYAAALKESLNYYAELSGAECIFKDTLEQAEIAGRQYVSQSLATIYDNGAVYQDYYLRKKEGRIICIVVTYVDGLEEYAQELLDGFYPYGEAEDTGPVKLEGLKSQAAQNGDLCAAAYLVYAEGGYSEFMTLAKDNGILQQYPFLEYIPEENTVLASGGEWYLLVPADDTVTFKVSESVLDETTYTLVAGKELLQLEAGESLLLRGNVSDIYPSFMVTITGPDGTVINYAPGLSLRDGFLNVVDGVYDFTVYAEGQLEEN